MVGDSLVLFLGITSSSTTYAAFVPAQWAEAIVFFAWLMVHFLATFLYSWVMGLLLLSTWASLSFSSMLREFNSFHLKWLWFLNKCFFFFYNTTLKKWSKKIIEKCITFSNPSTLLPPNSPKLTSIQFTTNEAESHEIAFFYRSETVKYR